MTIAGPPSQRPSDTSMAKMLLAGQGLSIGIEERGLQAVLQRCITEDYLDMRPCQCDVESYHQTA